MLGLDVILGGVTGLLGNALTSWFKFKNAKLDREHEQKMVKLETDAMIQEAKMQIQVTQARIEGEIQLADAAAFDTSQKVGSKQLFSEKWIAMIQEAGNKSKWFGWVFTLLGTGIAAGFALVDWLNGFMRPGLTIYLTAASTYITWLAWTILKQNGIEALSTDQAVGIFTQVTSTIIYLTVSAITWWYGDRTMSKFLQEQGKNNNMGNSPSPKKKEVNNF